MGRLRYLKRCLVNQFNFKRFCCPNCDERNSELVDRKYVVTQLRRCRRCKLLFRTPTDDPTKNQQFSEEEYAQGFTTDMPPDPKLEVMKMGNFAHTEKDYSYYIGVLKGLGLGSEARVFDFGCSWGYGSYQLTRAGYDVAAFEIDRARRRFAEEKLMVRVVEDMHRAIADRKHIGRYNCFFSAHVLEHVPRPVTVFEFAYKLVADDGFFVSFIPNGSRAFRETSSDWHKLWGEVHPNLIDDVFLDHQFRSSPRVLGSSPVDAFAMPNAATLYVLDALDRAELMLVARKRPGGW